ncbi:methyltransferase domain-containing protein [Sporolactobacillus sp. CPB3-1]|uniref:Methyltransferase domain-containing protein n=1 Tax=Sporolactobacillus mangiferae TaxID=2940498 RepID=A0ABT0MAA7_9BACL|nr:methyltransferase domain-containing protein [Sporolactobacillus mangiferae]MCL1631811.1 methyltransferase domain-containing protein [Sporolactobacillus mangiferae]
MSKRLHFIDQLQVNLTLLKCPICGQAMAVSEQKSLICKTGHTFDIARKGYVNFLTRSIHTAYGKDLFEARRRMIAEHGFFDPLLSTISEQLKATVTSLSSLNILDLGCGEGSSFSRLCQKIVSFLPNDINGFGIDLSKDRINSAAVHYPEQMWFVADLAYPPFEDGHFDCILNLLSPSNYTIFNRLLKPGGCVIKVIPGSNYLKELRTSLYDDQKAHYSNQDTLGLFKKHYPEVTTRHINYVVRLKKDAIHDLIKMTPLAWNASEENQRAWLNIPSAEITADFDLLIGKSNKRS